MKQIIVIPDLMREEIKAFADFNGWSLSRSICYLLFVGMDFLASKGLAEHMKFQFDVDAPKRRAMIPDETTQDVVEGPASGRFIATTRLQKNEGPSAK